MEIQVKKLNKVTPPKGEYLDIVAFQLIVISINFFGKIITDTLDTKILTDGRQVVIGGNGYIQDGHEI